MVTASKWRPDIKMLARKKSMRLKLTASSIVSGKKTVVTPLIQHNNNNWPSSRTKQQPGNIIHSSTVKLSRLESEQVEFPFSLSTSSPVLKLVVDTFTISITVMWLSTDQGQAYGAMRFLHFHRCKVSENAVSLLFLAS